MCMQGKTISNTACNVRNHTGMSNLEIKLFNNLKTNYSTRAQCGPRDVAIGDIAAIDFSVMVVNGMHKDEKALRMICLLRGVHIIKQHARVMVSLYQQCLHQPN